MSQNYEKPLTPDVPSTDETEEKVLLLSFTKSVDPKNLHSSKDTLRHRPLYWALENGCTSIEVDVWKFEEAAHQPATSTGNALGFSSDELYVGHSNASLRKEDTLDRMYLDPLYSGLVEANEQKMNHVKEGVFFKEPRQTLHLWLNIKKDADATCKIIEQKLQRFVSKYYVSYYDPHEIKHYNLPLAIHLTGNVPWEYLNASDKLRMKRYAYVECPLTDFRRDLLWDAEDRYSRLCKFATAALKDLLTKELYGEIKLGKMSDSSLQTLRQLIGKAQRLGLKIRVTGSIQWPQLASQQCLELLWEAGVDYFDTNDQLGLVLRNIKH